MRRVPRAVGPLLWVLGAFLAHAILPLELSRQGGQVRPSRRVGHVVRGAGLLTVAAGAGLAAWALATHYEAAPEGWALEPQLTPDYLLRTGPYRLTRNPMYVGEAAVWLGWTLFTGSPAVAAGLVVLCGALALTVRWEERRLTERFGDDYLDYGSQVPRWPGRW